MNAKELMIGDWVEFTQPDGQEFYAQVEALNDDGTFAESGYFADNMVNPIPLTDEILAKNGFVKNNDHRVLYVHRNAFCGFALGLDADDYGWHLTDNKFVDIDNVHDLQHLLRLCGVEKEIVL